MDDVCSIVITSFSATIHSQLLLEAARKGQEHRVTVNRMLVKPL